MLLNIQSLRNKTAELYLFLSSINFPQILLLTEHWLKVNEPLHLDGYRSISRFSRSLSKGGGTVILARTDILDYYGFVPYNDFDYLIDEKKFEVSVVYSNRFNMYILCAYRSPGTEWEVFINNMELILCSFPVKSTIVLSGDWNINFRDETLISVLTLKELFLSFDIKMHVSECTRVTGQTATLLDYFCSNIDNQLVQCTVHRAGLSDHEAVLGLFNLAARSAARVRRTGRLYSRQNYDKFSALAGETFWGASDGATDYLQEFHATLSHVFNLSFPIIKIKQKKTKPWITKGLKTSSRNMRSLHYIRKFNMDNDLFNRFYFSYRSIYRRCIRKAKELFYSARIERSVDKQREIWSIVNDLRGKYSGNANGASDLSANDFNDFCCTIAGNLMPDRTCGGVDPMLHMNASVRESFYFNPVDSCELVSIFAQMKNKKSSGWDGISLRIFEHLPDSAVVSLADAIDHSVQGGYFPSFLKSATVIPMYKGGHRGDLSNYRPISLLPTLGKIVEKVMSGRIITFLEKHNVMTASQFGFQKGKNTSDAMFDLLGELFLGLNCGELASAVFCDITKAFDTVRHDVLLRKLEGYGFRGACLTWLRSYLSNRRQTVRLGAVTSSVGELTAGVPQGSILGPLLFLIYVNDLPLSVKNGKCVSFADDTAIVWRCRGVPEQRAAISEDLSAVRRWCLANGLTLNISKTHILNFNCDLEAYMGPTAVSELESCKYLGLEIDRRLKFEGHVNALCTRVATACYALRSVRQNLGVSVARNGYFSLAESHLRYGICFWGACRLGLFDRVFRLQKRAVRSMCGLGARDSCRAHFIDQRILTLPSLFIFETACLMHRKHHDSIYSHAPSVTRSCYMVRLPVPSSALVWNSVLYLSGKIFNSIPVDIRGISNFNVFKRQLKYYLINKSYYSVAEFLSGN